MALQGRVYGSQLVNMLFAGAGLVSGMDKADFIQQKIH
jgi:hypothetical protein